MDENPYKSPQSPGTQPAEPKPGTWHPFTWTLIGFLFGGVATVPFLERDVPSPLLICGSSVTGALFGLLYGIKSRR